MGRPRGGKAKKSMEPAKTEDAGSGGEEVIPAYKRRGRPQKLHIDEEADVAKVEDDGDGDGTKEKIAPAKESTRAAENGGKKRRRQTKRGSESGPEEKGRGPARAPNGFRQNGSRRKSTPRRAAEAGVESK